MTAKKALAYGALFTALIFSAFLHFSYLGWGSPSMQRDIQVFGSMEELSRWIPKMIEQRNEYYSILAKMLDKDQPFQESYLKQLHRWDTKPWQEIPQEIVLDRMRNFILGVNISDEQITLSAISALNPKKLKFAPGNLGYYGGVYYYTAAAFLVFGKIFGMISLVPGVEYYFSRPEEIRKMYGIVRAVSGVFILATILVLFFLVSGRYGYPAAALGALYFAVMPLAVPFSHLAKAHFYAAFWLSAGLYFSAGWMEEKIESKSYSCALWAGFFLGLSAGTIITNLAGLLLLLAAECLRQNRQWKRVFQSRRFWIPAAIFILVYCVTNFYIFLRLPEYFRLIRGMVTYFTPYVEVQWHSWIPYLKEFCTECVHWSVLPLLSAGFWFGIKG